MADSYAFAIDKPFSDATANGDYNSKPKQEEAKHKRENFHREQSTGNKNSMPPFIIHVKKMYVEEIDFVSMTSADLHSSQRTYGPFSENTRNSRPEDAYSNKPNTVSGIKKRSYANKNSENAIVPMKRSHLDTSGIVCDTGPKLIFRAPQPKMANVWMSQYGGSMISVDHHQAKRPVLALQWPENPKEPDVLSPIKSLLSCTENGDPSTCEKMVVKTKITLNPLTYAKLPSLKDLVLECLMKNLASCLCRQSRETVACQHVNMNEVNCKEVACETRHVPFYEEVSTIANEDLEPQMCPGSTCDRAGDGPLVSDQEVPNERTLAVLPGIYDEIENFYENKTGKLDTAVSLRTEKPEVNSIGERYAEINQYPLGWKPLRIGLSRRQHVRPLHSIGKNE